MGQSTEPRVAGILLAAGAASRFGSAKQVVAFEGVPLVRRTAQAMLDCALPLTVVTGAHADPVVAALQGLCYTRCHNAEWARGMGRSIGVAFATLIEQPQFDAALVCLADQPLVDRFALRRLLAKHLEVPDGITASAYDAVTGPPCVFARCDFAALARLDGTSGARTLIGQRRDRLRCVPMPDAAIDIDTPEQYRALLDAQRS